MPAASQTGWWDSPPVVYGSYIFFRLKCVECLYLVNCRGQREGPLCMGSMAWKLDCSLLVWGPLLGGESDPAVCDQNTMCLGTHWGPWRSTWSAGRWSPPSCYGIATVTGWMPDCNYWKIILELRHIAHIVKHHLDWLMETLPIKMAPGASLVSDQVKPHKISNSQALASNSQAHTLFPDTCT